MKLAAVIPFWLDRPSIEAMDIAVAAEDAGFDELWIGEMVTFDAFALAGAIAQRTTRITLVCGPLPFNVRSPIALALGSGSVTTLGGRPSHLALGASTPFVVTGWHDGEWNRHAQRAAESIDAIRTLFAGDRVKGFRLRDAAPTTEVRLAAFGPRMLDLASAKADGVVVNLLTPAAIGAVRGRIGRSPLAAWVPAAYAPGPATYEQLRRQLAVYVPLPGYGEMFAEGGFGDTVERARAAAGPKAVAGLIDDEMIRSVCAVGDERAIAERLREYAAAGVDTLCVVPATADDPGGEKVLRVARGEAE